MPKKKSKKANKESLISVNEIVESVAVNKSIALGHSKDKITALVTVIKIKDIYTLMGNISEIHMKDSKDNIIIWKASNFNPIIKIGNKIKIYAKIKEIKKLKNGDELTIVNYLLIK